jgi:hypothetical protein
MEIAMIVETIFDRVTNTPTNPRLSPLQLPLKMVAVWAA